MGPGYRQVCACRAAASAAGGRGRESVRESGRESEGGRERNAFLSS